jgi:uncharacterized protein DUF1572
VREPFSAFIEAISEEFASLRMLAERAAAQVSDEQFFAHLDNEANSIGTLMQHIGGNLRSRWQEFRTTDGEKPDRFRDREFESAQSRAEVEAKWRHGWATLRDALDSLEPADIDAQVVIRGQAASLPRALMRNLSHVAGHVHQIVLLAKHWRGSDWQTLSIPRGQSEQFRAGMTAERAAPKGST